MKKRLFSLLLALTILLPHASQVSAGERIVPLEFDFEPSHEFNAGPQREHFSRFTDEDEFCSFLREALISCQEDVDISKFHLPVTQGTVQAIYYYVMKDIPEAFHVHNISFYTYQGSEDLANLEIEYAMDPQTYADKLAECRAAADAMLDGISDHPTLTEVEKALLLHDRLALSCEYDVETLELERTEGDAFHMTGAFLNSLAVCEGYAKAYSYLLDQIGLPNYYCSSAMLKHGWNVVYIDSQPYHVDVTWDDAKSDVTGFVSHENFLRSTYGFISTGHHTDGLIDYDTSFEILSTRFDDAWWLPSDSAVILLGDAFYFIDHEEMVLCSYQNGSVTKLRSIEDHWLWEWPSYWQGYYACLTTDGNDLFFSLSNKVYRLEVNTGRCSEIWSPEIPEHYCIYGIGFERENLICDLHDSPNFGPGNNDGILRRTFIWQEYSVTKGDVDGNGSVDSDDAIYLLFHILFGADDYPVSQDCNFDSRGTVDSDDAIYLLFHTLFGSVDYPLH